MLSSLDTTQVYTFTGYIKSAPGDVCGIVVSLGAQNIVNVDWNSPGYSSTQYNMYSGSIQPQDTDALLTIAVTCQIAAIFSFQNLQSYVDDVALMGPNPACNAGP